MVYIYGDYVMGTIWGLLYENGRVTDHKKIAVSPMAISSFGEDAAGEVYVVGYSGSIYQFVEKADGPPLNTVPNTISASGLFKDIETLSLSEGLIPYTVNAQLWSDNALKTRILALPDTSKIVFSEEGIWKFPPNSVIAKNFFLETERGNPETKIIIETRFLVRHSDREQWDGFSYLWNDEQTDAILLDSSYTKTFVIIDGDSSYIQNYYYPDREDCKACHTPAAGFVLGPRTAQLNKTHFYENGVWDNQLRSYNHIRLFTTDIGEDYTNFPKMADPFNDSENIEKRARSYLDANCSNCHQPSSSGRTNMDLRYNIPLEAAHLINVTAELEDLGIEGAMRIDPGSPDSSILLLRILNQDEYRMPPLATSLVDIKGTVLISDWIDSLEIATKLDFKPASNIFADFHLYPAYPNPFNPLTTIAYNIPVTSYVNLSVYNLLGQKVHTIVSSKQTAGRYEFNWNAGNFASGIYYCRLETDKGFIQTRKIILLK